MAPGQRAGDGSRRHRRGNRAASRRWTRRGRARTRARARGVGLRLPAAVARRLRRQGRSAERLQRLPRPAGLLRRRSRPLPLGVPRLGSRCGAALHRSGARDRAHRGSDELDGRCDSRFPASASRHPSRSRTWSGGMLRQRTAPVGDRTFRRAGCHRELPVWKPGTAIDPASKPGLASLTAALVTEGAGQYDAIALSDALARIGAQLATEVGTDVTTLSLTVLSRHFEQGLSILSDIVRRPRMSPPDFERVRDLRLSRLKQLARTPATAADRVLLTAVYGNHPYGHGALGTTRSVRGHDARRRADVLGAGWRPTAGALLVAGDISADRALAGCEAAFGDWTARAPAPAPVPAPDVAPAREIQDRELAGRSTVGNPSGSRGSGPAERTTITRWSPSTRFSAGNSPAASTATFARRAPSPMAPGRRSTCAVRVGCSPAIPASRPTRPRSRLSEVVREMREVAVDGRVSRRGTRTGASGVDARLRQALRNGSAARPCDGRAGRRTACPTTPSIDSCRRSSG